MDLTDFVGHNIKIQFTIVSDGGLNYDGFYFDDLQVIKVIPGPIGIHENADHNSFSEPQPNPASDNLHQPGLHHARRGDADADQRPAQPPVGAEAGVVRSGCSP